jgi:copper(I)-binding protein
VRLHHVRIALVASALMWPAVAAAHGFTAGSIEVVHPFFRATAPGAPTGAGYVILRNTSSEPDRLIGIETEAAAKVTFHRTVIEDGIAKMVPIEGGLVIPPGGEYRLGLDGTHAMLEGLTAPIGLGQVIEGTLVFEKAGRVDITFEVESPGATQEGAMESHSDGH